MKLEILSFNHRIHNISPRVWGKGAWIYLHTSALVYPRDDDTSDYANRRRAAYREELRDLPLVVPCEECRSHLARELESVDIDRVQKYNHYNSVILWLHNQVRERQGKAPMTPGDVITWLETEGLDLHDCEQCTLGPKTKDHRALRAATDSRSTALLAPCAAIVSIAVVAAVVLYMRRNRQKERAAT